MNQERYATAGWLAITSVLLVIPSFLFSVLSEVGNRRFGWLVLVYLVFALLQSLFSLYAFYRFKQFLNLRCEFRDADPLIVTLICCGAAITLVGLAAKVSYTILGLPKAIVLGFALFFVVCAWAMSVVTIFYGLKMLRLGDDLGGLARPYAYLNIGMGACGATVLLLPFAMLAGLAGTVVMGIILVKADGAVAIPEYV